MSDSGMIRFGMAFPPFWGYRDFALGYILPENIPPKLPDFDKSYSTSLDKWQEKTRYF